MNGASPRRTPDDREEDDDEEDDREDDHAKVSAEGTTLVWPARVAIAL